MKHTRTLVYIYAAVMFIAIACQCAITGILPHISSIQETFLVSLLNGSVTLPISELAYCWVVIVAAYSGVDRAAYALKTSTLEYGTTDFGDPSILRRVILLSGLLLLAACVASIFCSYDFELSQFAAAFGSSVVIYVAGQKAIKCTKYMGDKIDANNDNIPDEDEKEYYKWERAQRKAGVDARFINYDYFCDDREDASSEESDDADSSDTSN